MGGGGKVEGFADGEWTNHRQAALAAATQISRTWDEHNSFDGAHSIGPAHSRPHGQTSLPVPPGIVRVQAEDVSFFLKPGD